MSVTQSTSQGDVYDQAIAQLSGLSPNKIYQMWNEYDTPLFDFMRVNRKHYGRINNGDTEYCGCPSQVVHSGFTFEGPSSLKDELVRLNLPNPDNGHRINPEDLVKFAAAQRLADKLIPGRLPPK